MNTRFVLKGLLLTCLLIVISACSPNAPAATPKPVYTVVTEGTLKAGDAIPAPSGEAVFTITGKIGTTNADKSIVMDLPTVESVGLVDYKVTDPFEKKDITYRGVLMSKLLDLWKVPEDATKLHMVALNDYSVDVPIGDLRKYPVVFALQADGAYMPVATRGPAMLVYPYNDFEFETAIYNDYWIWQIKSIDVQ
jgi:hypothetical protein